MAFAGALFASGYVFPLIKTIEVVAGLLLLSRVAVPFALVVLAPIIVNIVAFHSLLAPAGLPVALLVLVTELHLAGHIARRSLRCSRAPRAPIARLGHGSRRTSPSKFEHAPRSGRCRAIDFGALTSAR